MAKFFRCFWCFVCTNSCLLPSRLHAKYLVSASQIATSFRFLFPLDSVAFYRCWFLSECHAATDRWCWGLFLKWDLKFPSVYNNPTQKVCIVSCSIVWPQNYFFLLFPAPVTKVILICFPICWRVWKKRGMYSSWLGWNLSSAAQALNVGPVRPHIHANLTFVCTVFVLLFTVVRDDVWIFSIIVGHRIVPHRRIVFPTLNYDVDFCSSWLNCGTDRIRTGKRWFLLRSAAMPSPSCPAASSPDRRPKCRDCWKGTLGPVIGIRWHVAGIWWKEITFLQQMSVFLFGTLPLQLITCIIVYRWLNLLLNVRETSEMVKY